ncbi:MAG: hypothetical protein Q9184_002793 [Pyrenodesmia sp. 2 TL-2023]
MPSSRVLEPGTAEVCALGLPEEPVVDEDAWLGDGNNFWDTRIAVSGTAQSTSRIPEVPDQSDFIRQWFDWHRGYTLIRNPDGTEERRELIGETLSEVGLGRLPRTLEALHPPSIPLPPEPRRHRLRRRLAASTELTDRQDQHNTNTQHQYVTNPSMTRSHATDTAYIDPDDRIFESSNPASPLNSDSEDSQADSVSARQRLLSNLQQNLDEVRANVLELTQRTPGAQNVSQVSSVTSQINAITRRLTRIRQQTSSGLQNNSQSMSGPFRNPRGYATVGSYDLNWDYLHASHGEELLKVIDDDVLRQLVLGLSRDESIARAAIVRLGDSNDRESVLSNLETIATRRQRATQEQALRQQQAHREAQLWRDFGLPRPAQTPSGRMGQQDYTTAYNDTVPGQPLTHNSVWTPRYASRGAGRSGGELVGSSNLSTPTNYGFPLALAEEYIPPISALAPEPSTEPRSSSYRARHITRRRPTQPGSEAHSSGPLFWHPPATDRYSLSQDPTSGYPGEESTASQESAPISSLRETTSPAPGSVEAGSSRAPGALLDAHGPPLVRTRLERLYSEQLATGRFNPQMLEDFRAMYRSQAQEGARREAERPQANLDSDTTRPEPVSEESMTLKMECKICFAQISNHALLPCGK